MIKWLLNKINNENMKKLASLERVPVIIALGNPGQEYSNTRHNVARMILNTYKKKKKEIKKYKFKAAKGGLYKSGDVFFQIFYPATYMNLSGNSVKGICAKLSESKIKYDLLIVHDDIDVKIGKFKFKKAGGSGGHNGIKSIISSLGSKDFNRLRIGIGSEESERDPDFVLGRFYNSEIEMLDEIKPSIFEGIDCFISNDIDIAMNKFNQRKTVKKINENEL